MDSGIKPMIFKTQSEFLKKISEWGFTTNPLVKTINGLDEVEVQHKNWINYVLH